MPPSAPRIVAGHARGRRLAVPAGNQVRPTKDRVKEAVFSALDARGLLVDAVVADLCAGSGALGLEALSRGAASATFVERDRGALAALRANVEAIAAAGTASIVASDALAFAGGAGASGTFDLVFVDPPYAGAASERDALVAAAAQRAPGGTIVLETAAGSAAPEAPPGWRVAWERRFGDTLVIFLQPADRAG